MLFSAMNYIKGLLIEVPEMSCETSIIPPMELFLFFPLPIGAITSKYENIETNTEKFY